MAARRPRTPMHARRLLILLTLAVLPTVPADPGCEPTAADSSTVNVVPIQGATYYLEERETMGPLQTSPVLPGSGLLLGQGTWAYRESNGLPGLQRGGPGMTICSPTAPLCVRPASDPVEDEACGAPADELAAGVDL